MPGRWTVVDLPNRDRCVRDACTWLAAAEQAIRNGVKLNDSAMFQDAAAFASLSAAYSALALVVPDPIPADLPDEIKARIQAHHNKGHFTT